MRVGAPGIGEELAVRLGPGGGVLEGAEEVQEMNIDEPFKKLEGLLFSNTSSLT